MQTNRFGRTTAGLAQVRLTGRALCLLGIVALLAASGVSADDAKDQQHGIATVQESSKAIQQIMGAPDKGIPVDLLDDGTCVAVFPNVIKGAFIFGGQGGKGCVVVRDARTGRFGQPLFLTIGGGSVGFQIGGSSTDFVLVGTNQNAVDSLTKGEWTLGADAAVAGGPVGRSAKAGTDWKLDAQFLSYSRSKGAFAGVSLDGSKVSLDKDRNSALYGKSATPADIVSGVAKPDTRHASSLMALSNALARYAPAKPRRN